MKISTLLRFLSCAFVATALSLSAFAQTQPGLITAKLVKGDVQKISDAGVAVALKDGDLVAQTDSITTGKGGSVVLIFANASSVRLGPDSRLRIDEFLMDELDAPISNPGALKEEPNRSKTALNLSYGEMVGDVKKLNTAGGSSYSIKTPVGAAGIRGTIYRIVFRPSSDGKAFFQLQTAEGLVVMEGVTNAEVSVAEGKEVVVEVDTEKPGEANVQSKDISEADKASITNAVSEIVESLKTTTIDNTTPPPQEEKKEETPPPPPPPVPDNPDLTPGAGKS